ncbi:MAG: tail fiber protein [Breznakibacter sp.]
MEIKSTKKGVLLPRVDDAQSADKVKASLLFDNATGKFKFYDGTQWLSVNPLNPDVNDNVMVPKDLTVAGNTTLTGNAAVGGNTTLDGTVQVDGTSATLPNATSVSAPNATVTGNNFVGYGTIPLGGIIMWSGNDVPDGWVLCHGGTVTDSQSAMYSKPIPDLRGRFIVGSGQNSGPDSRETENPSYAIGNKGGINKYTLSEAEMPKHKHDVKDLGHTHKFTDYGKKLGDVTHDGYDSSVGTAESVTETDFANISETEKGNNQPHENRPPYYVLAFIMRVK